MQTVTVPVEMLANIARELRISNRQATVDAAASALEFVLNEFRTPPEAVVSPPTSQPAPSAPTSLQLATTHELMAEFSNRHPVHLIIWEQPAEHGPVPAHITAPLRAVAHIQTYGAPSIVVRAGLLDVARQLLSIELGSSVGVRAS